MTPPTIKATDVTWNNVRTTAYLLLSVSERAGRPNPADNDGA